MNLVAFAKQIIDMQDRIEMLEAENARLRHYEAQYRELLNSSVDHSSMMAGGLLKLALIPGVIAACQAEQERKQ